MTRNRTVYYTSCDILSLNCCESLKDVTLAGKAFYSGIVRGKKLYLYTLQDVLTLVSRLSNELLVYLVIVCMYGGRAM